MGNGASGPRETSSTETAAFQNFKKAARFTALFGNKQHQQREPPPPPTTTTTTTTTTANGATPFFRTTTMTTTTVKSKTTTTTTRGLGLFFSQRSSPTPAASRRKFPFMPKSYNASPRNSISPDDANLLQQPETDLLRSSSSDLKQFTERRRSNIIGSDIGLVCEKIQHRMEKEVEETQKILPAVELTKRTEIQHLTQNGLVEIDPSSTAWAKLSALNQFSNPYYKERLKRLGMKKRQDSIYAPQDRITIRPFAHRRFHDDDFLTSTFLEFSAPLIVNSDNSCCLCRNFSTSVIIGCRVCANAYHQRCLNEKLNYGLDECSKKAMESAYTQQGWSCPECENIGLLLDEFQTHKIIEEFELLQRPWDCTISFSDWLKKKKTEYQSLYDKKMPPQIVKEIEEDFKNIDPDGSGSLSWMEFLVMESLKTLNKLPKNKLVTLLHPLEVRRLKIIFAAHDLSGSASTANGVVNEKGAKDVYREWMEGLGLPPHPLPPPPPPATDSKDGESATTNVANLQTWQSFLLEKVLCIVAARPNIVMGGNYVNYAESLITSKTIL